MVSDQVFIFFPSSGPNGSILNAAKIEFPHNHILIIESKCELSPPIKKAIKIPKHQRDIFVTGPANAMRPNCVFVVLPETITAPGAMNTIPRIAAKITPNLNPAGLALNSAQQPYFLATILCAISCNKNAGVNAMK